MLGEQGMGEPSLACARWADCLWEAKQVRDNLLETVFSHHALSGSFHSKFGHFAFFRSGVFILGRRCQSLLLHTLSLPTPLPEDSVA